MGSRWDPMTDRLSSATATELRWERWYSVFDPSDDAATHWRLSETALSFVFGTRVVGAFGLLFRAAPRRSRARESPIRTRQVGTGGGLALATNPRRMRVSLVNIGIILGMIALILVITLV